MATFTRTNVEGVIFERWVKIVPTRAVRIKGPFTVRTREGELTCPDGYLALDSADWPYPIAKDEFERIYWLYDIKTKPLDKPKT